VPRCSAGKQGRRSMSAKSYTHVDEYGVIRVGKTRVMLDSVVAAFQQGQSAETIQQQFPSLTLEQIYGAIAYYLGHQDEVDAYLQRQGDVWDRWRDQAAAHGSPVVKRIRERSRLRTPEGA
jgi:uncharacterized protein (DUF433 family)